MNNLALVAKGYDSKNKRMLLWSYGNYKYEIEKVSSIFFKESEVFDSSFEEAMSLFKSKIKGEITHIM